MRLTIAVSALIAGLFFGFDVSEANAADRTFVHMLPTSPNVLDPAKSNRIDDDQVMWLIYDALTQLSADGSHMIPALAERWETSPDGLTYTFTLRKNVRFHDGTLLDAEAVKISYERQFLRTSPYYTSAPPNAYERVLSGFVKELRVLDPSRVAITTQYSRPAQFAIVKIVSPQALKQHKGDLSRAPVGTGPFSLAKWDGAQIVLSAFAESWQSRPKLDAVRFVAIADDHEAMDRLGRGEFDFVVNLAPDFFEQLRANPRVTLMKYGGLNTMFLGMQMERPALKDRRVREAIVRAVDRERLASFLGRGAMIAARGPLPPNCVGFSPAISQPAYDPDRTRAILRDTGLGTRLSLRLIYFDPIELWSEVAHSVQSDLRKLDVTLELVRASSWQDFHTERKKDAHDLYLYQWSVSTPDPERFLFPLFHSESPDNFGHFVSPKVDKLLMDARHPMDEARRLQLYGEAMQTIVDDIPALFLVHRIGMAAVSSRVKGLTLNLYGNPQDKLATVEIP
jgi:peptide/nickel transport system substrate-binding protein